MIVQLSHKPTTPSAFAAPQLEMQATKRTQSTMRVRPDSLVTLSRAKARIRNVCIIAHVDHGKTSLADTLIASNGIISERLAGSLRFLDSTEDEQKRGITMQASAISLRYEHQGKRALRNAAESALPPAVQEVERPPEPPAEDANVFLVNLVDSPGHIDFSSDVSTATRLCDGAIVVVDVVEGVCIQTQAVLRQAWRERIVPVLVLNKLDRLVGELQLTPLDAHMRLRQVVENVNAVCAALIANEDMESQHVAPEATSGQSPAGADFQRHWEFDPVKGNVVFTSAIDGFGFTLAHFARMWSKKLDIKPQVLRQTLWGDFTMNPKTKKCLRIGPQNPDAPTMFSTMVLQPLWAVYEAAMPSSEHEAFSNGTAGGPTSAFDPQKLIRMASKVDVTVAVHEVHGGGRSAAIAVLRKWIPLAPAVLGAVALCMPSPVESQRYRTSVIVSPSLLPETVGHPEVDRVVRSLEFCATDGEPAPPVVAFVSKVISAQRKDLTCEDGRWWTGDIRHPDPYPENGEKLDAEGNEIEAEADDIVLLAFARVFSGVLTATTPLFSLPKNFSPTDESSQNRLGQIHERDDPEREESASQQPVALFLMMGAGFFNVESVPAGNICAIAFGGIEKILSKAATLSSSRFCPSLAPLSAQAVPFVRVAVMPDKQSDLGRLEKGLAKLYQAEPAVEVTLTDKGEHIIAAIGELHLEHCLKDLAERYCPGVAFTASKPLLSFRETIFLPEANPDVASEFLVPPQVSLSIFADDLPHRPNAADMLDKELRTKPNRARVLDGKSTIAIVIRCMPLPEELVEVMSRTPSLKAILSPASTATSSSPSLDGTTRRRRALSVGAEESLEDFFTAWHDAVPKLAADLNVAPDRIDQIAPDESMADRSEGCCLAFGPNYSGTNMLLATPEDTKVRLYIDSDVPVEEPSMLEDVGSGVGMQELGPLELVSGDGSEEVKGVARCLDGPFCEFSIGDLNSSAASPQLAAAREAWRLSRMALTTGFQLCTAAGVLAGEPLHGCAFFVERVEVAVDQPEDAPDGFSLRLATGNLIAAAKSAFRVAQLSSPCRIVEAFYRCDVQCHSDALGKCYAVLSRRRADIEDEDIIEGTQFFMLRAKLPFAESFGLAQELLIATSGAATTPQLAFAHWRVLDIDPFWKPRSEEEREDEGEAHVASHNRAGAKKNLARSYVDEVRKRRGMPTEQLVVVDGTKQRTLARKK